jgi:uncharacterized protein (TIGR02646 family)
MIRITKPTEVPEILQTKGAEKCDEMCRDYDKGVRKFKFKGEIYGHKEVKDLLIRIQNDKCVYCETKFTHDSPGDIEHFRPKSLYYWLAYDWKNLFLSCEECNRRYKKNNFPLIKNAGRNKSHHDSRTENPYFINPEDEDPENYISFRGEIIYAKNGNVRGKRTIKGMGLNRTKLENDRRNHLKRLKYIFDLAQNNPPSPLRDEALAHLEECASAEGEYSAMVKAALAVGFKL